MDTTMRPVPAPKISLALVAITLLVALAAIVVVVGSQTRLPEPFGLADNGAVLYATKGDIYLMTPAGEHKIIVSGSTNDFAPNFSRDGSKFAFLRAKGGPGRTELMLANADGGNVRPLSAVDDVLTAEWSPDGSRIAVASRIDNKLSLWTVDVATGTEAVLVSGMGAENIAWTPDGDALIFRGEQIEPGLTTVSLYRVGVDGSGLRPLVPAIRTDGYQMPAVSPDGTRVVYTQWDEDTIPGGHLYAVDVDGGEPQRLRFDGGRQSESDYFAVWSPDGSKILFNRGTAQVSYHLSVAAAGGGAVVDLGPDLAWDAAAEAAFSPDGSKVIARYGNGQTWILDVDGSPGERLDIATSDLMSWQRVAR